MILVLSLGDWVLKHCHLWEGGTSNLITQSTLRTTLVAILIACGFARIAQADPVLQLYLEGATYNTNTESWELQSPPGSSSGNPFRLWVIGNVDGPGGHGTINNVRLAVAYDATDSAPLVSLTPTTTGGLGGFFDPSTPINASLLQTVTDGSSPILGNGRALPPHGIYGQGVHWQEFGLGDFELTDSPVADFISSFPDAPDVGRGQINVYDISVLNGSGMSLHFDVYNTIEGSNHARFAPFSHDADGDTNIVPAPAAGMLAMVGFAMIGSIRKRSV